MSSLKFKLSLSPKVSETNIIYPGNIMLIGSCFTENIGAKFKHHLFEVNENAHGILFNPISVQNALLDIISNKQYTPSDLFFLNELWNSWHHHSRFSGIHQNQVLQKINTSINNAHHFLKKANHLVITLGSAWLYLLNQNAPNNNGLVVANNHKAPANWFTKKLMQPTDLTLQLNVLINALKQFNPNIHIIFTISPVRHLREGLVENNRSKAVLIQSVHDVIVGHNKVEYFPAYEYVIDDLRDYRFYAEDLVHPNYLATNYVWEQLLETYISTDTQIIMKQVSELQLALNHKPFNSGSAAHQKFIESCIQKVHTLMLQHPSLPLQEHLHFFKSKVDE